MSCVSLCELTEGICRSLLSILMSTVSADNLNANGEAGWGGQHGPMSDPLVVLTDSEAPPAELGMVSWLVSLGLGYTYPQKDGFPLPTSNPYYLTRMSTTTHYPARGLVSKAVVGHTEVTW